MVLDFYGTLLQELGDILGITLKPDRLNSCLLKYKTGTEVQIEMDRQDDKLILASYFQAPQKGRLREDFFREALRSNNNRATNQIGFFAYSRKADKMVFFIELPVKDLRGSHIADRLPTFVGKVEQWAQAIANGDQPPSSGGMATQRKTGMFGL